MEKLRFFTDEDVYAAIAPALRKAGLDAVSTPELSRLGETDESQLIWAANHARVLVSFNVAHFASLHVSWMEQDRIHVGIIVSRQLPIGELLRRLLQLAESLDETVMRNRLEFLSDW